MKNKLIRFLDSFEDIVSGISMFVIMIIVFLNAASRYIAGADFGSAYEIVTSLFVVISLFSGAAVFKTDGHIGFDVLVSASKGKVKTLLRIIRFLLIIAFFWIWITAGVGKAMSIKALGTVLPASGFPGWILALTVPIAGGLSIIRVIQCEIINRRSKK